MDYGNKFIQKIIANQKKVAPLFLDLEFTDLDIDIGEIYEIGWTLDKDGQTVSEQAWIVEHEAKPSQWVLDNTKYNELVIQPKKKGLSFPSLKEALEELIKDCDTIDYHTYDIHLIGCSPWLDIEYLRRAFKKYNLEVPYHWRIMPIESIFVGYFNRLAKEKLNAPTATAKMLKMFDFTESENKHTTRGDNEEVRKLYYAMFS